MLTVYEHVPIACAVRHCNTALILADIKQIDAECDLIATCC